MNADPLDDSADWLGDAAEVTVDDFYAYMPTHQYIFVPTREMWPAASVNGRIAPLEVNGKKQPVTTWIDATKPIDQMTWAPGEPLVIAGKLIDSGGWIDRPGCNCFNLYRGPKFRPGNAEKAGPWRDHVYRVFPDGADHIVRWLAHRVQRPGDKINHALVLGGAQGIGKDTILEPVKHAVGPWNFTEVSPAHLLGRFNGFIRSVILRVSEARDLGDLDRYAFYDHMKAYTAAPPDVLRCDEKHLREYAVMNVTGVIITSNHKTDGIYLPADDRRHYVAWSDLTKDDFSEDYWRDLYRWYADGGHGHVAAYLATLDLSGFDPKAPPPKTAAFHAIVDANRAPEDSELADALDALNDSRQRHGEPVPAPAITLEDIITYCTTETFREWLQDRKNRRQIPHRLETAGYVPVRNDADKHDGQWKVGGKRQTVYARHDLTLRDRIAAAQRLCNERRS